MRFEAARACSEKFLAVYEVKSFFRVAAVAPQRGA